MELAFKPKNSDWRNPILTLFINCCCSVTKSCSTLCNLMDCSTPGFPLTHYLPEFAQIHILWVSDAIQLFHPLLSPFPPAFNLSWHQDLFQCFSLSISPSNEYLGLVSFRIDSFDLLAVQRTFKNFFQLHSSEALYFSVQPYLRPSSHTGKWPLEKP